MVDADLLILPVGTGEDSVAGVDGAVGLAVDAAVKILPGRTGKAVIWNTQNTQVLQDE